MKATTFQVRNTTLKGSSLKTTLIHSSNFNYCLPITIFPVGSPLQFYVDAVNSGVVTAYGPGLSYGMVNKSATFTVVTKNAGEGKTQFSRTVVIHIILTNYQKEGETVFPPPSGGLSLAVEGPSKAEITCKDNKDGTCTVSYLPTAPGDYNIIVKFDNKHISGSPFTAKITGEEIAYFSD